MTTKNYMATCPKGLENLLAKELLSLNAGEVQESVAAVYFSADLGTAYNICLWSRLANRVLLLLERTRIDSDEAMYQVAFNIPWAEHFSDQQSILVDFNGTSAYIRDARFGAKRIKDAINDHFVNRGDTRLTVDDQNPQILIYVRLFKGRLSIGLDLVGESLHKRAYRIGGGAAPLKENLAAAMLMQCDWPNIASQGGSFVDPMCGSGTLLIEAALMAANIPPTFLRLRGLTGKTDFNLSYLADFDAEIWQQAIAQLEQAVSDAAQKPKCVIQGYDIHPRSVALAQDNIALAGLDDWIEVKQCDIANLQLDQDLKAGLLLVNPPYGERLGDVETLKPVYSQLGDVLKRDCMDWQAAVFTGNLDLGWETGLRSWRQHRLYNGGIECQLQRYRIEPGNFVEDRADRGKKIIAIESLNESAQMLANRLRKNRKRLKRWLATSKQGCYRLYDADLPEYVVAIDCYTAVELIDNDLSGNDASDDTSDSIDSGEDNYRNDSDESSKEQTNQNYYKNAYGTSSKSDSSDANKESSYSHSSSRNTNNRDSNSTNSYYNKTEKTKLYQKTSQYQIGRPFRNALSLPKRQAVEDQGLYIHMQEYAPPANIDAAVARKRIKDAVAAVSAVLEVPMERIYVKRRERQRGAKQYQKLEDKAFDMVVEESGHKFKVNLGRYLDTGIFLDHRPVRQHIAAEIKGKRFLNLYSYTSSATVYAALAGASQSVSIDLSNSYLHWSQHNFELNQIDPDKHQLVRADCMQWLEKNAEMFDYILLDPPSFSNSKRMENTLDISRDQAQLVDLAMRHLNDSGSLYFSNNKRGFALADEISQQYDVQDITTDTLDPDFERGRPAHKCWLIRHKTGS